MADKVIAIVDDEPLMVDMLSTFLQLKGYQIRKAYSGQDGLTLVQVEKPNVLLLDLMLPDIDGFQVCERLRQMPDHAQLPILIVSARTDQVSMARAKQCGASGYLTKPVRFPQLLEELERLISQTAPPETPLPTDKPASPPAASAPTPPTDKPVPPPTVVTPPPADNPGPAPASPPVTGQRTGP